MFGAVIIKKTVDIIKPCLPEDHVFIVVVIVVLGSALQQIINDFRFSCVSFSTVSRQQIVVKKRQI